MIRPGRLLYLWRMHSHQGWTTPYYRGRVRPRILDTAPVETAREGDAEAHVLTSRDDLLNLLWALKTFYHFSGAALPLVVHGDGTLGPDEWRLLAGHFPAARLVPRAEADAVMAGRLAAYPRCLRFRAAHPLAVKAFDFGAFLRAPKLFLLDSDVLFFSRPDDLLSRLGDPGYRRNAFNADALPALNVSAEEARAAFGVELVGRINSGLAVLQREVFDLPALEEFLGHPALTAGPAWRVEQTLLALAASRQGAELLPPSYRVSLAPGLGGCVAKHYVGAVRHLMYREGMARLARGGFLRAAAAAAGGAAK